MVWAWQQPAVIRAPRPTAGDHDEFSLTPTALDSPKGKRTSGWDHLLSRNSTNSKIPLQVRPIMRKYVALPIPPLSALVDDEGSVELANMGERYTTHGVSPWVQR